MEKLWARASGPPDRPRSKLWGSPEGVVTTSTRIWPRFTLVKVQVTVSPAESWMAATGLPSPQTALCRSQPAGSVCTAL
jgi:hypothetical protein